jgi:hypothetical protein
MRARQALLYTRRWSDECLFLRAEITQPPVTRQHALLFCALCDAQACLPPHRRPGCHRLLLQTLLAWAAAETCLSSLETQHLYFAMDCSLHQLMSKVCC